MITELLAAALGVYACIYLLVSVIVAIGVKSLKSRELSGELSNVSVVICARNEEKIIRRSLDSMLNLDYPRNRLEILLVDDESEDGTLDIFKEYAQRDGMFRVLSTAGEPRDLPGKQRALNLGISQSTGEIVLGTDADIAVKPGWIKAHLSAYLENVGIVGSTTRVDVTSGKIFDRLQCRELITKLAVAMGCAGLGLPVTPMGNNISFRRDAYEQVGGFSGMDVSIVEDMALMNAIVKRTHYKLGWITDKKGVVISIPEKDFATFINQRMRWTHEVNDLSMIGKFMITMETLMFSAFVISLALAPWNPLPVAVIPLAWIFGYYIILLPSQGYETNDLWYIPGVLLFQIVYSCVIGARIFSGNRKVVWKGRVYQSGQK
ncbi:glycosyltransferase [Candidatus Latescibacterota bacterium]